ncbi:hypothetical protein F183_A21730 [Bryobacterales bacterium F-183]|nr:hypothetical protein F183_A21730 [Bryobacterales bacterium F-183]
MTAILALLSLAADLPASDRLCATCHKDIVQRYYGSAQAHGSTMARALYTIDQAAPLLGPKPLTYKLGKYSYTLTGPKYSVTDGATTLDLTLAWAFGQGAAGQTYVYQHQGTWYESRLSFYKETKSLDLTMGAPPGEPRTLIEAAGREMTAKDVTACFGCHTTNSIQSGKVVFEKLQAGIGCQNCHENALKHARTMQPQASLAKFTTEEQSDFCGRCHRTWADIASGGPRGVGNVRFQPYRIANSRCYDAADRRIACTACHDPHGPLEVNAKAYDSSCLNCHSKDKKACSNKQADNCTSCHMPKYEIPGSHHLFTDHQIRIVRPNEKYPN